MAKVIIQDLIPHDQRLQLFFCSKHRLLFFLCVRYAGDCFHPFFRFRDADPTKAMAYRTSIIERDRDCVGIHFPGVALTGYFLRVLSV